MSQYLIALCNAPQENGESFGISPRIGMLDSKFNIDAAKIIHGILTFSPAPESVAIEFLNELAKVSGMSSLVEHRSTYLDPTTWATTVMNFLSNNFPTKEERVKELQPVTDLATEMLNHLLIATRNPGGKKTPQESIRPSPDINRLQEIQHLLSEATTHRSQSALKELVFLRDGHRCPSTNQNFVPPGRHVFAQTAHILPFSFRDKHLTLSALEKFTGRNLAEEVKDNINHPSNAFNIQSDAHISFDKMAWGIEAVHHDNEWKYFFRSVHHDEVASTIQLSEGQEIIFGCGEPNGQAISKPNPEYCNIILAIARVMHACGAADIVMELYGDDDHDDAILTQPVYMGGPFVPDDILFRRLEDRLLT